MRGGNDFDSDSANKRQTTVSTNQILMQEWFLLQNIEDSSLNLTFVMVFCVFIKGEWTYLQCFDYLAEFRRKFPNLILNRYTGLFCKTLG
jgi:hypothetical protein